MKERFRNPITEDGADPFVVFFEGKYYYVYSAAGGLYVSSAENIHKLSRDGKNVFAPPEGTPYSKNYWAPEIHLIGGRWYLYVAADDGCNANHRMYVLESENGRPDGVYKMLGKITDSSDCWAIDGTVLVFGGRLYFVWSGWEKAGDGVQNIYIAPMSSPAEICGERVLLSAPDHAWECRGAGVSKSGKLLPKVNEGPQILYKDDAIHIIYSASGSWCRHYCLGRLTFRGGDPLDPKCWQKYGEPVFSEYEGAYGPGHCSFTKSVDGREDFIIYHARRDADGGWTGRGMRAQPFTWDKDVPVFGRPVSPEEWVEIPV
mgnify:FL=1